MPTQEELDAVRDAGAKVTEAFAAHDVSASQKSDAFAASIWTIKPEDWDEIDTLVLALHKLGSALGKPGTDEWPELDGFPEVSAVMREGAADPGQRDDHGDEVEALQDVLDWISGSRLQDILAMYTPEEPVTAPPVDPEELAHHRAELAHELEELEEEAEHLDEDEEKERVHHLHDVDAHLKETHLKHEHLEVSLHQAEHIPRGPKHDAAIGFIEPKIHELEEEEHVLEEERQKWDHVDTELLERRHHEIDDKKAHVLEELTAIEGADGQGAPAPEVKDA